MTVFHRQDLRQDLRTETVMMVASPKWQWDLPLGKAQLLLRTGYLNHEAQINIAFPDGRVFRLRGSGPSVPPDAGYA